MQPTNLTLGAGNVLNVSAWSRLPSTPTNAWNNLGSLNVSSGTLNLYKTFTLANLGSYSRTGGALNIYGLLNNTGNTLRYRQCGSTPARAR